MKSSRKKFLSQLETKRAQLKESLAHWVEKQREYNELISGDNIADETDSAQREIDIVSTYGVIERKTRELKKIDYLIAKILKDENFGICEECGEPIPDERLLIVPEAVLCVPCQRDLEKFDQMRNLANRRHSGFEGRAASEWEDLDESYDLDYEIIETDVDVLPFADLEEPDNQETSDVKDA
jgi:DnaK suppressor protein